MKIVLRAGILNILLNLVLIPLFGIHGAVVSSFLSYTMLGFGGFMMKEFKPYIEPGFKPLQLLLMLFGASGIAFLCIDLDILWKLVVSGVLILAWITWYLKKGKVMIKGLNAIRMDPVKTN
jgi:O-antigen/teichoic acid export membrane protein